MSQASSFNAALRRFVGVALLVLAPLVLLAAMGPSASAQAGDEPVPEPPPSATAAQAAPPAPPATPPAAPSPNANTAPSPSVTSPCPVCDDDDDDTEGRGAFLLGLGFFDLSKLNDRLVASGYEAVDDALTVIGGEGHAVFANGFVAGGMGAGILGPTSEGPREAHMDFGGGFGMLDLGFALVHTRSILFTVLGSVGGYGWTMSIDQPGAARFDDVLDNPRRSTSLTRGGMLAGLTLAIEGRIPVGPAERGRQGFFSLGLRAGGLYGPPLGTWSLADGSDATAGPDTRMAGVYSLLTLGFGGWRVAPGATPR